MCSKTFVTQSPCHVTMSHTRHGTLQSEINRLKNSKQNIDVTGRNQIQCTWYKVPDTSYKYLIQRKRNLRQRNCNYLFCCISCHRLPPVLCLAGSHSQRVTAIGYRGTPTSVWWTCSSLPRSPRTNRASSPDHRAARQKYIPVDVWESFQMDSVLLMAQWWLQHSFDSIFHSH